MIIIGEKITNFVPATRDAIADRDASYIRSLIRMQTALGADYLDCCALDSETELEDLEWLIRLITEECDLPVSIDSPDPQICVEAMGFCGGRAGIINSMTGETYSMDTILPAIAGTDWGCVAILFDDNGIPASVGGRMAVLHEIMERAEDYAIPPERLYIDPIVNTLAAEGESFLMFEECIRRIRALYPRIHIVCGVSNISYGLPKRSVFNTAFLALAMRAGLDSAVMDPTNEELNGVLHATSALIGQDRHCSRFLSAYRKGWFGQLDDNVSAFL